MIKLNVGFCKCRGEKMLRRNKILLEELKKWYENGEINEKTFKMLSERYSESENDVDSIMRWLLIMGVLLIFVGGFYFGGNIAKSMYSMIGLLSLMLISGFYAGFKFLQQTNNKYYYPKTGSTLVVVSSLIVIADLYYMLKKFDINDILAATLSFAISAAIYFYIAYIKKKRLFLIMANLVLLAFVVLLVSNIIANPTYAGKYYYYAVLSLGAILFLLAYMHNLMKSEIASKFKKIYYYFSLIEIHSSFLALTLCKDCETAILFNGNYKRERGATILIWAAVSILMYYLGKKRNNRLIKIFSIAFLIVNVYIRYIEVFWDVMSKGLFFLVLGFLSTAIGVYFENLYRKRIDK